MYFQRIFGGRFLVSMPMTHLRLLFRGCQPTRVEQGCRKGRGVQGGHSLPPGFPDYKKEHKIASGPPEFWTFHRLSGGMVLNRIRPRASCSESSRVSESCCTAASFQCQLLLYSTWVQTSLWTHNFCKRTFQRIFKMKKRDSVWHSDRGTK